MGSPPRPAPPFPRGLDLDAFFRTHWQRRPLLLRGALPGFRSPLAPEELAGLACEPGVESRLVVQGGGRRAFSLEHGPFEDARFEALPERRWTVLVQEVNRWVPEAARLLDAFAFVPNVRLDDVMVSYAADGGGVGAHLDSYDVFLVQGHGRRRWRWHETPTKDRAFVPGLPLRVLARFAPDRDEVLEPGDVLYLPAGFAHEGTADGPCMTYSVGFRAPSEGELLAALALDEARSEARERLWTDPWLRATRTPGALGDDLLRHARDVYRSLDLRDEALDRAYGRFATRLRPGHDVAPPRRPPTREAIAARLARGHVLVRSEEGRFAHLETPSGVTLFFAGDATDLPRGARGFVERLGARRVLDAADVRTAAELALVHALVARGALSLARRAPRLPFDPDAGGPPATPGARRPARRAAAPRDEARRRPSSPRRGG